MGHVSEGVVQSVPLVHLSWPHLLICEFSFIPLVLEQRQTHKNKEEKEKNKTKQICWSHDPANMTRFIHVESPHIVHTVSFNIFYCPFQRK